MYGVALHLKFCCPTQKTLKGCAFMQNTILIGADEIAKTLDVSKAFAYKVVRSLNNELKQKGYIVIAGKVSRKFFEERFYGCSGNNEAEGEKVAE